MGCRVSEIAIDLEMVDQLVGWFRDEVGQGLTPAAQAGLRDITGPVPFGDGSPSGELMAARTAAATADEVIRANLSVHLSNADTLVTKLETIVAGYREADVSSSLTVSQAIPDRHEPATAERPPGVGSFEGADPDSQVSLPSQRDYQANHQTNWRAYDVPRLAEVVAPQTPPVHRRAHAYECLGDGLDSYCRQLRQLRRDLAQAWPPERSSAAEGYLRRLKEHADAVEQDGYCARVTAIGLSRIADTLEEAKAQITGYDARWPAVTSEYAFPLWPFNATLLNEAAAAAMTSADSAIRDWRRQIVVPAPAPAFDTPGSGSSTTGGGSGSTALTPGGLGRQIVATAAQHVGAGEGGYSVPPVPGLDPVVGLDLTGTGPAPMPISAANPPSMLPIAPGASPIAPHGGAFVLPGPGVGSQGHLLPAPGAAGAAALPRTGARGVIGSPGGAGAVLGQRGVPATGGVVGAGAAGRTTPIDKGGAGKADGDEIWPVRQGVPSVIDKPQQHPAAEVTGGVITGDDLGFNAWFAKTATPWAHTP